MDTEKLTKEINTLNLIDKIKKIANEFSGKTVFTTSFGIEDQVLTDIIFKNNINIEIATLDTGRLFEQTYKVFNATREKYKKEIKVYCPQRESLEKLLSTKGPHSFYNSIEERKECCNIRKVEPLRRALKGHDCWVTGLRAEQSCGRTDMKILEEDEGYKLTKFNPLLSWALNDVVEYLEENNVPYNSLHHQGYISIGCQPCTRAVKKGEDFRAGRWWWEQNSGKECGLHTHGK